MAILLVPSFFGRQPYNYFPDLSWSFLHGHTYLTHTSPTSIDVSPFRGQVYLYWPPLTALLMMPIVPFSGPEKFPTHAFSAFFGALNTGLFFLLFDRLSGLLEGAKKRTESVILAVLFGFGTSNVMFAASGWQWYVPQLTAATFTLLAIFFGLDRRPEARSRSSFLSFVCFAVSLVGRANLLFCLPVFVYLALSDEKFRLGSGGWASSLAVFTRPETWRRLAILSLPVLAALGGLMVYNQVRFGNVFEFGLTYHNMAPGMRERYVVHGYSSVFYFPRNLYYNFIRLPAFEVFDHAGGGVGHSVFWQSPFLFLIFMARRYELVRDLSSWLWLSVVLGLLPILSIMGAGEPQVGARYLFDLFPFIAVLMFIRPVSRKPLWWLGAASLLMGFFSAAWTYKGLVKHLDFLRPWLF